MTHDDFISWKNSPVTQVLFAMFHDRIEQTREVLGNAAGIDVLQDRFFVGYIKGLEEILNSRLEAVEGEDD